jgi:hypothetical protein
MPPSRGREMPSQPTSRLGKWRPNAWQWAGAGLVVAGLVVVAAFAWRAGRVSGGYDSTLVERERREAHSRVELLERENSRLNARVAELEMSRQLDREAYGQIEQTLADLQAQLSTQGGDLAFYRSIVSPADGIQGLRIHRFEITPADGPREFRLALTLIQAMRHESLASGLVQIAVTGLTANRPARHTVGELLGRPRAQLPFSFRYFQTMEQNVTLPADFEPLEVEVEVRSSKLKSPVRQNFPWKPAGPPPL